MRRALTFGIVAIAAAIAPAPAQAKEHLVGAQICGTDRCVALDQRALPEAAAILAHRSFRRSGEPVPFYDVLLVWRDRDGATATYGALRWAPEVGATRTSGARGPVWSRTSVALTAALSAATIGLRPRPDRELDEPVDAVGPATQAARRRLAAPAPPIRAAAPEAGDPSELPWIAAIVLLALTVTGRWSAIRRASP
jgi:hypothetical protein